MQMQDIQPVAGYVNSVWPGDDVLSDPVILLQEISAKLEDDNVETLYTKRLFFFLGPLSKYRFQEMSIGSAEWKHVVKVSEHMHGFSYRYSCNGFLRMR